MSIGRCYNDELARQKKNWNYGYILSTWLAKASLSDAYDVLKFS